MRWLRFEHNGKTVYGVASGDTIEVTDATWCDILAGKTGAVTDSVDRGSVDLLCPMDRPGKIVAIGLNYLDHCRETNTPPPDRPVIFTKFTTSIVGPGDEIVWSPQLTAEVDYEAELAAVIGKTARHVSRDDALDYVAGYTCSNDVSARDIQFRQQQWHQGKSYDTFCPMGPWLVTKDEIPDPNALAVKLTLNGTVLQDSNTDNLIFNVPTLVSRISSAMTLLPGDVISTGTPAGVGVFRDPKILLKAGDYMETFVEGIGTLKNHVR